MGEYSDACKRTILCRGGKQPMLGFRRPPKPQVDGAPVHWHKRTGSELVEDAERGIGVDVHPAIERVLPPAVVPTREHAPDREQGRRQRVVAADFGKDPVV